MVVPTVLFLPRFQHPVHHLPPQTTSVRGGKSDCHSQFQIYVNLWRGEGYSFELLLTFWLRHSTLFFPPQRKDRTPSGQKFPFSALLLRSLAASGRLPKREVWGRGWSFEFLPRKLALSSQRPLSSRVCFKMFKLHKTENYGQGATSFVEAPRVLILGWKSHQQQSRTAFAGGGQVLLRGCGVCAAVCVTPACPTRHPSARSPAASHTRPLRCPAGPAAPPASAHSKMRGKDGGRRLRNAAATWPRRPQLGRAPGEARGPGSEEAARRPPLTHRPVQLRIAIFRDLDCGILWPPQPRVNHINRGGGGSCAATRRPRRGTAASRAGRAGGRGCPALARAQPPGTAARPRPQTRPRDRAIAAGGSRQHRPPHGRGPFPQNARGVRREVFYFKGKKRGGRRDAPRKSHD